MTKNTNKPQVPVSCMSGLDALRAEVIEREAHLKIMQDRRDEPSVCRKYSSELSGLRQAYTIITGERI